MLTWMRVLLQNRLVSPPRAPHSKRPMPSSMMLRALVAPLLAGLLLALALPAVAADPDLFQAPILLQDSNTGMILLETMQQMAAMAAQINALTATTASLTTQLATTQQQLVSTQQQLEAAINDTSTRLSGLNTRLTNAEQVSGTTPLVNTVAQSFAALSLGGGSLLVTSVMANTAGVANLVQSTPTYKNRLFNGDFGLDSISHSFASQVPATLTEVVDGWWVKYQSAAGSTALRYQRQPASLVGTLPLPGFMQLAMSTGDTSAVAATDHAILQQTLPWGTIRDFAFGTTAAAPVTISFWIFHYTAGIWGGSLRNAAATRSYPFSYTVVPSNVFKWALLSVTIPGDKCTTCGWWQSDWILTFAVRAGSTYQCTAGAWTSTNCLSVTGAINMGSSSTSVVTMQISGIQLEKSNVATAFDIRPYNTELMPAGSTAALRNAGSGLKNRLLNGAFNVDQMRRGAAGTLAAAGLAADRWQMSLGGTSTASMFSVQLQQVGTSALAVTPPLGFSSYLAVRLLKTVDTPLSSDVAYLFQSIERRHTLDFQWGTPDAQDVTLSFYVRAPVAGLYSGALRGMISTRAFTFTYTVAAADTWQRVEIRVPGDTFEGTPSRWPRDGADLNTVALDVVFNLLAGSGSVSSGSNIGIWYQNTKFGASGGANIAHSSISNAAIYFTGVQLERGLYATAFDARPASDERQLVQRYITSLGFGDSAALLPVSVVPAGTDYILFVVQLPVVMRVAPTLLSAVGTCDVVSVVDATTGTMTATGGWTWSLLPGSSGSTPGSVTLRAYKASHGLAPGSLAIRCPTSSDGFILTADYY